MQDVAEQMRQAAGDMSRNDPENAARSSERAAEGLRRLEGQMRGDSADARRRASADLQTEAQQIAQEQRRITSEAERLEKSGAVANADARRRLAADKDRLAERVDALQREAQRLGGQEGRGQDASQARDAARRMEKEQIGERMREGARQLRDGNTQPSGGAEGQLARVMEQVLETLGGTASAEARQMADQIEQSRQTRAQLDALEARMREAQGKGQREADKARLAYEQALQRTRDSLGPAPPASQRPAGGGGSTPETHEFSRSAPGTEAFKQDRSGWESLRKAVDRALEARDAAASRRLARALGEDRLAAGGSERVPEQYRRLVARYYESLGRIRK
jgi:hypothetical protein